MGVYFYVPISVWFVNGVFNTEFSETLSSFSTFYINNPLFELV